MGLQISKTSSYFSKCNTHGVYEVSTYNYQVGDKSFIKCELDNCPICTSTEQKKQQDIATREKSFEQRQSKINQIFSKSPLDPIPVLYKDSDFNSFVTVTQEQKRIKNKIYEFTNCLKSNLTAGKNLILIGNAGTGKTHLSIALAKYANKLYFTSLFLPVTNLVSLLNAARFEKDDVLNRVSSADLLILDDIGAGLDTNIDSVLYHIINMRYNMRKTTVITSNLPLDGLRAYLGVKNVDRLRDHGTSKINFIGESYRK